MSNRFFSLTGGTGGATSGAVSDADAMYYIGAVVASGGTVSNGAKTAIEAFVAGLKTDNIWTKMKAIYPFIGGIAAAHKWNLKDPRDLDAAFRLAFNGGWTYSATGVTGNGVNTYADTFCVPSSQMSLNDSGISVYIGTDSASTPLVSMGCVSSTGHVSQLNTARTAGSGNGIVNSNTTNVALHSGVTDTRKMFTASRLLSTEQKVHVNGVLNVTAPATSTDLPNVSLSLGARYNGSTLSREFFTDQEIRFAAIHQGLNATEALNFYMRVHALQTALGRANP